MYGFLLLKPLSEQDKNKRLIRKSGIIFFMFLISESISETNLIYLHLKYYMVNI
ncbi:MAG: hypothetical protein RLZZ540_2901 [Bacteroidota bacterium]|jgi:hypothetical protein